jgi:hypothetical protein
VSATREHDWERPPPGFAALLRGHDLSELPFAAHYHGVMGCLYHSLRATPEAPTWLMTEVTRLYHLGMAAQLRIMADLRAAVVALEMAGVDHLVVKGPVLAEAVYSRPDLRNFKDVDLVVRPEDFGDAVRALEGGGIPMLDRNWRLVHEQMRGQLHFQLPRGTVLDLHWHLVNQHRGRFAIDVHSLLERSRRVEVGGVGVSALEPVDALLHLCLHAALSGGDQLVWIKDLEQTILNGAPDWRQVVVRAREWGVTVQAGVMLSRAAHVLHAAVPEQVIAELLPGRMRRWSVRALEHARPPGCARGEPSLSRLLVRTAGQGAKVTALDAGRRVVHRLCRAPDRAVFTNPMLRTSGGEDDRQAYLAAVARESTTGPVAAGASVPVRPRRG